jgi:PPK2 family polyphosphate:nucleotide phosphotransferase
MSSNDYMNLSNHSSVPGSKVNEKEIRLATPGIVAEIGELQLKLYAEGKKSLLVILQGMDASGKDGAVKDVFMDVNPMGIRVVTFKKPSEEEYAHDFLWRVHQKTPPKGMIHVFNRSHYEDILVPAVEKYIPEKIINKRFDQINDFEKLLEENDTKIIKFFLHVSKKEQEERLRERLTNPKKFWKHKDADWNTREKWDEYMEVYSTIFKKCSNVPWQIIPSDKNWYKEFLMAEIIRDTLREMDPRYPGLETKMKLPG